MHVTKTPRLGSYYTYYAYNKGENKFDLLKNKPNNVQYYCSEGEATSVKGESKSVKGESKSVKDESKPVKKIKKIRNIGYDFDGVLHTDVTLPDHEGQRHPVRYAGEYNIFRKIVDQMKKEIEEGHKLHIITARSGGMTDQMTVDQHLYRCRLDNLAGKTHFTANQNKLDVIKGLKLDQYYDDSCLRIMQLYEAKKKGKLPADFEIFLVKPEKRDWILMDNDEVVDKECSVYKKN